MIPPRKGVFFSCIFPSRKIEKKEKTCNVCLTHPKYVKAIKGKKTDKKDAKWISELFKCDLVRSSFIYLIPKTPTYISGSPFFTSGGVESTPEAPMFSLS